MLTITEIKEKLVEQVSEVDLIDMLGLTTEDIVEAFHSKIEDKYEYFLEELE
jgi:hypothetical protein